MYQFPSPEAQTFPLDEAVRQLAAASAAEHVAAPSASAYAPSASGGPPLFYDLEREDEDARATNGTADPKGLHEALTWQQDAEALPLVMPFQPSTPLPSLEPASPLQAAAERTRLPVETSARPEKSMHRLGLIALLLLLTVGAGFLGLVLALSHILPEHQNRPGHASAAQPAAPTPPSGQAMGLVPPPTLPSMHMLAQLGWSQAGLTQGDALEAIRTAQTFVDREMSYDYRTIGTPTQHGGTFTAAMFLLTAGGMVRFVHNDVREINNTLYNQVRNQQRIQQVMASSATITQFQVQTIAGMPQQFAWLDMSFVLWQSRVDTTSGRRIEGIEQDAATQQPRIHHMSVILLRVPPSSQGPAAPMGGTGWLVNVYALDSTTPLTVATSPTV